MAQQLQRGITAASLPGRPPSPRQCGKPRHRNLLRPLSRDKPRFIDQRLGVAERPRLARSILRRWPKAAAVTASIAENSAGSGARRGMKLHDRRSSIFGGGVKAGPAG